MLAQHLKLLAYKYDRVSRVAPIFYLESAIALFVDVVIFNVTFTLTQVVGIVLVLSVFIMIIVTAFNSQPEEQRRDGHSERQVFASDNQDSRLGTD